MQQKTLGLRETKENDPLLGKGPVTPLYPYPLPSSGNIIALLGYGHGALRAADLFTGRNHVRWFELGPLFLPPHWTSAGPRQKYFAKGVEIPGHTLNPILPYDCYIGS